MDFSASIKSHILEYYDEDHLYLVDGVIVPSITQMMRVKFGGKYTGVDKKVLKRAAEHGTLVHQAIEDYCRNGLSGVLSGTVNDLPEVRNFRFLESKYGFEVVRNEEPVILFDEGEPIAAGRYDLEIIVHASDGNTSCLCGADIKSTSALDKEYLAYQLNLYRLACKQSYDRYWDRLYGVHLRGDVRRMVRIPVAEELALEIIHDWRRE